METIVLKFGGSSMSDNIKLNIVANKIIEEYNKNNKIVVVVSAQGKTTDNLIKEARELSAIPNDRELDALLSTGEQVSISKLSILLNRLGYNAISLTGWQAGIQTSQTNQNAIIESIDIARINNELNDGKIVIIAGFQGINLNNDITTLGRGGSDTTAVAVASALSAKYCYIFSDVDGVYTADPNKVSKAQKIEKLSYDEMLEIANEGAKVLHNRCIQIGKKFNIPIITKSTFNNKTGSLITTNTIEDTAIKSIVKNDDLILIDLKYETYSLNLLQQLYKALIINEIIPINFINNSLSSLNISFLISTNLLNKFQFLLENDLKAFSSYYTNTSKISIIGSGINNDILTKIINILELNNLDMMSIEVTSTKITIIFKEKISNLILEQLHNELIYNLRKEP